jgi:hypothetical protein
MLRQLYETIIHFKHPADIEKPYPQAIFITSGTPSNALPLTPISDVSGPISAWRTLIITDRIAGKNSSVIFRGNVDGIPVIVKVAEFDKVPLLSQEAHVYGTLTHLQGKGVPHFYGAFFIKPTCVVFLMEDCGAPLTSFSELCQEQR